MRTERNLKGHNVMPVICMAFTDSSHSKGPGHPNGAPALKDSAKPTHCHRHWQWHCPVTVAQPLTVSLSHSQWELLHFLTLSRPFLPVCALVLGVHPYWIGDLDTIIMKTPELYRSHPHGGAGLYGNRKSLSQQLEFPHGASQVSQRHLCPWLWFLKTGASF